MVTKCSLTTVLIFVLHVRVVVTYRTMDEAPTKSHRSRQAGPKAVKKKRKAKDDGKAGNQKAFTFKSAVRAARSTRRTLDKQTKKHHIPVVDRQPREPPPAVVMVAGPPRVGKTTLISSLVKNYTRQNVVDAKGPVTVVSGELVVIVTLILLCHDR